MLSRAGRTHEFSRELFPFDQLVQAWYKWRQRKQKHKSCSSKATSTSNWKNTFKKILKDFAFVDSTPKAVFRNQSKDNLCVAWAKVKIQSANVTKKKTKW